MIFKLAIFAVAAIYFAAAVEKQNLNSNLLLAQKTIYDLFYHVDQPDKVHTEIYKLGTSWDISANIELYTNRLAVTEFLQRYKYGMLPRGKLFSIYYPALMDEAKSLFDIFYHARDMQTFLNTAAWARIHMNEKMFIYAFTIAVVHRPDCAKIRLPLPYEVLPEFYFSAEIMQQAYDYKMALSPHDDSTNPQTFYAQLNCTGYINSPHDPETRLSYYLNDVDLNAYYYNFNQECPFWMSGKTHKLSTDLRGELYLYIHKILMNRYYLERLSNGLGEVEDFNWDSKIITGFTPSIAYRNGIRFPERPHWSTVPVHNYKFLQLAKEFESRITEAIDSGFILTPDGWSKDKIYDRKGFNLIANLIEGNKDSVNHDYYGSFDHLARAVFGFSPESEGKYENVPNALEYHSTSLRDPAFYRIYKRIMSYVRRYKEKLPIYSANQLTFDGVELESVAIDKMYTFFDYTDALISNGVKVHDHKDAESILIKARQPRLNHNPFTYHITVNSEKKTKASIRIFLGPKYDIHGNEIPISENYENFYELDYFVTDLKSGTNKIERKSSEAAFTIPDIENSDVFYKKIVQAVENSGPLPGSTNKKFIGFPDRLILPKGSAEGFPVRFFFYVSEFLESSSHAVKTRLIGEWVHDNQPFGFPLDRPVFGFNFTVPNMLFKDGLIYHKEGPELNLTT